MEVRALAKSVRISPRKLRLIADAIRNLPVDDALRVLTVAQQRAAGTMIKTLNSAVANAVNNAKLDRQNLFISSVMVNEAQALKRFHPSTRGRIHPYKKRGSHVEIVLKEKVVAVAPVKQDAKPEVKAVTPKPTDKPEAKAPAKKEKSFLGLGGKKEDKK